MNYQKHLFGLPEDGLKYLCYGLTFFLVCLGIKYIRSPNTSLKVANAQLITSSSADRLEELAEELERQAVIIEQKEIAYRELEAIYEQSLKGKQGYGRLQTAIEAIDDLPEVENIEQIQTELSLTEQVLKENITK